MTCAGPPRRYTLQRNYVCVYSVALVVVALDQLTKGWVSRAFHIGDSTRLLGSVVSLTFRTNTGGAFSILSDSGLLLTVVTAVVTLLLLVLGPLVTHRSMTSTIAVGAILGGAAGNLVDRIRLGYVIDFIDFHFWPAFNVADIAITLGALSLVATVMWTSRQQR